MQINTIMFDLDGTLLPMDLKEFIQAYFQKIAAWLKPHGYESKQLIETIWNSTVAMMNNNGQLTNEAVFWNTMESVYGSTIRSRQDVFDDFYISEFEKLKNICGYQPLSAEIIHTLQDKGYRLILATNPLYPKVATKWRIRWTGLKPEDFSYITTYENSCFCKPNLNYYREILEKQNLQPETCLMVGNDVTEDMTAAKLGMDVFLLTDCLINREKTDIYQYKHGDFQALKHYLDQLPCLR